MNEQTTNKTPETIDDLVRWSTQFLTTKGFPTGRLDTELLLCHVLKCRRIDLYIRYDEPLTRSELNDYKTLLIRRLKQEPVAYIIGYKEFMSLRFAVNPSVLIPRSETELLVERAVEFAKTLENSSLRILEIGTGSGCIGISLLHLLKNAQLEGWDISPEALNVSRANAHSCGIEETRYEFLLKDARDENSWNGIGKFDIIISNPPYISIKEKNQLARSVIDFEPELALFAESNGLAFYQKFAVYAREHLSGKIFLEIGSQQGPAVTEIFTANGWKDVKLSKDYSRLDRLVEGLYE